MSKNTIDDHLQQHRHDYFDYTKNMFDSEEFEKREEAVKQALYQDLMALVGEDEAGEYDELPNTRNVRRRRNDLRQELRQNINQYFKRGEGDG